MSLNIKNSALIGEFEKIISPDEVRHAYYALIGVAATLPKFDCYPTKGVVVSDFRYYTEGTEEEEQPFAFIINKGSLLFYLRSVAVSSGKYSFDKLKTLFREVNENPKGEWTIRVNDLNDAIAIIEKVLLIW